MKKKFELPTLYHKGKTGAVVQWDIWTEGDTIYVRHGQIGGKLQLTPGVQCTGKNIGKSNETTPEKQAILEAKAMWTNKVERKYSETLEEAQEEIFLPMLAHDFKKLTDKAKGNIQYPIDVQPKLDGVRAMAYWEDGRIVLGTRGGKEWTAPTHIIKELEVVMPQEMVLDGELYIHEVDFESLTSWAKKKHIETPQLEYHVFDMPINEKGANETWEKRCWNLQHFFVVNASKLQKVVCVPTVIATTEKEILSSEDAYIQDGYEGAIVREKKGTYLFGHRSKDLLKVKSSQDAEFKIVGFTHGKGSHLNAVKWICTTKDGIEFEVNPKTTMEMKQKLYKDGKKYIGKWLKVVFQNYTVDGKPRFGRSVGFRDPIDMD
jgi:ATP-dependent DNA ligase